MKIKKQDINKPVTLGFLHEAVDAILQGVDKIIDGLKMEMNDKFETLDTKVDFIHKDLQYQIGDIKHDTPSQKEFDDLKGRVDRFISA